MVKSTDEFGSNNGSITSKGMHASTALSMEPQLSTKANILKKENRKIPLNRDYNLPEYIFRADLVPDDLDTMDTENHDIYLNNAIVELDYAEGFPTMPNGEPLWGRLQCEDAVAYKAFSTYLDMPRPASGDAQPVRQIHMLKALTGLSMDQLLSFAHMYYWTWRATAYDAFTIASHAKMKEHRLLAAEAEHYAISTKFIAAATQLLEDKMSDEDADISAKEALDIIKFFMQAQRLSLGAQPFSVGVPENSRAPVAQSLEVIMRTLTGGGQKDGKQVLQSSQDVTAKLFENEGDLAQAQELIIRLADENSPRKAKQLTFEKGDPVT